MELSRQRTETRLFKRRGQPKNEYIVQSKTKPIRLVIECLLTSVMWLYTLCIGYFFVSALLGYNEKWIGVVKESLKMNNSEIRIFMIITSILFTLCFVVLMTWRTYNKKRFGKLNRRTMPLDTSEEEMLSLELVSQETYHTLQRERIIIFEENPVRDLSGGEKA